MKKFFIIALCALSSHIVSAQFFNPFQLQSNQNAYEYGRRLAAQYMAYNNGVNDLVNADYNEAWEHFSEAVDLGNPGGYEGLGVMSELGIGVERDLDNADYYYKLGARAGNIACRAAINRIENNGHYASSYKNTWLTNLRSAMAAKNSGGTYGGGSYGGNIDNSSGSSSSNGRQCAGCRGTGRCTGCQGQGGYYVNSGQYTGSGSRTWVTCGSCGGSASCKVCYGAGVIR